MYTLEINLSHNPYEPSFRTMIVASTLNELYDNITNLISEDGYYPGQNWLFVRWISPTVKMKSAYFDIEDQLQELASVPTLADIAGKLL